MRVCLLRHGIAEARDTWGQNDALRPLSNKGRKRMWQQLPGIKCLVPEAHVIVTSPLVRARSTAQMLQSYYPDAQLVVSMCLMPNALPIGAKEFVQPWVTKGRQVFLVTHEPFLSSFIEWALGPKKAGEFFKKYGHPKKGGLYAFNKVSQAGARVDFVAPPKRLRSIAEVKKPKNFVNVLPMQPEVLGAESLKTHLSTTWREGDRLAFVDVGTNSIKLDLCCFEKNSWKSVLKSKHMVRLGDSVFTKGLLPTHVQERALLAFRQIAQCVGAGAKIISLGTSALREAPNAGDFINQVHEHTGIYTRIIDGHCEAVLIGLGACYETFQQGGVLMDVGGGSVEMVVFAPGAVMRHAVSLPLGVNRLKQHWGALSSEQDRARFADHVHGVLKRYLLPHLGTEPVKLWGSSGTVKSLFELLSTKGQLATTSATLQELESLALRLLASSQLELLKCDTLEPERVDLIGVGAALVVQVLKSLQADGIKLSSASVREGLKKLLSPQKPTL